MRFGDKGADAGVQPGACQSFMPFGDHCLAQISTADILEVSGCPIMKYNLMFFQPRL